MVPRKARAAVRAEDIARERAPTDCHLHHLPDRLCSPDLSNRVDEAKRSRFTVGRRGSVRLKFERGYNERHPGGL